MIRLLNLSKSYRNHEVLKPINLSFEEGKVYGIIGENGAGKSTLFRCIIGIEEYSGEVQSDEVPLKNHIAYLAAEPYFFPKITGKEYLQLLANARDVELLNIETKNIFDLPLDSYASTYSTGMKKKLALMGTLIQQNSYFILDEPFNGIDIQSNLVIVEIIGKLKSLGKTIILSSHIFSTLSDVCDEIFVLKDGIISKKVAKTDFQDLEEEMKQLYIGNRIELLDLK